MHTQFKTEHVRYYNDILLTTAALDFALADTAITRDVHVGATGTTLHAMYHQTLSSMIPITTLPTQQ